MEGGWNKEIVSKKKERKKERAVSCLVAFPEGRGRGLTLQMTSLVLARKFQIVCLTVTFWGEAETVVKVLVVVLRAKGPYLGPIVSF